MASYNPYETPDLDDDMAFPPPTHDLDGNKLPKLPHCTNGTIVGVNELTHQVIIAPLTCGRWDCPDCSKRKAAQVYARMMQAQPVRMITLTMDPKKYPTPELALAKMKKALPKFIKWLRDGKVKPNGVTARPPMPIEYCAMTELHKSGYPHLHLASWGCYIHWPYLRQGWRKFTASEILDIRRMDNFESLNHNWTKYLVKTVAADHPLLRGHKLVTFSQGYDRYPVENPKATLGPLARWFLVRRPPPDVRHFVLTLFMGTLQDANDDRLFRIALDFPLNGRTFNAYTLEDPDTAQLVIDDELRQQIVDAAFAAAPDPRQLTMASILRDAANQAAL